MFSGEVSPTGVTVRSPVAWVAFRGGNEADEAN
jgi:hypothetical protein